MRPAGAAAVAGRLDTLDHAGRRTPLRAMSSWTARISRRRSAAGSGTRRLKLVRSGATPPRGCAAARRKPLAAARAGGDSAAGAPSAAVQRIAVVVGHRPRQGAARGARPALVRQDSRSDPQGRALTVLPARRATAPRNRTDHHPPTHCPTRPATGLTPRRYRLAASRLLGDRAQPRDATTDLSPAARLGRRCSSQAKAAAWLAPCGKAPECRVAWNAAALRKVTRARASRPHSRSLRCLD
jgi:hypothetical protein